MTDLSAITPLEDADGSMAGQLQTRLRALVLDGTLAPGSEISQVELARVLGVSRTPLREALRMLQEEGLIEAEPNRKARVAAFDAGNLDAVYASRISLEAAGIRMTAAAPPAGLADELGGLLERMEETSGSDLELFEPVHRQFHRRLMAGAPEPFQRVIFSHQDRAERYWRMLVITEAAPYTRRDREHREIGAAVRAGDPAAAAAVLARHLARTALTLMTQLAPECDVPATRLALSIHTAQA